MSSQDQPPQQPYQPYGNDPKAAAKAAQAYAKASRPWYKKKRWIALIALVVLIIIGVASGSGSSDSTPESKAPTNSQSGDGKSPTRGEKKSVADNSSAGKGPITWGNWEVVGRLQVTEEEFTHDYSVVTRVKNIGDSPDSGFFTVTILKKNEILGTADCSTAETDPGSIVTASCVSLDKYQAGYTEVTIEDAF